VGNIRKGPKTTYRDRRQGNHPFLHLSASRRRRSESWANNHTSVNVTCKVLGSTKREFCVYARFGKPRLGCHLPCTRLSYLPQNGALNSRIGAIRCRVRAGQGKGGWGRNPGTIPGSKSWWDCVQEVEKKNNNVRRPASAFPGRAPRFP
jgi:hypothetical protein